MRRTFLFVLVLFLPLGARAQDDIVVEAGEPVPVPLEAVAERLRAELPATTVIVPGQSRTPGASVTLGLSNEGRLLIVYRDATGRETTRIVADTRDPQAVAATIAMIVGNLHRSQLDATLSAVMPPSPAPVAAPAPPTAPPVAPRPPIRRPASVTRAVHLAEPARGHQGWFVEAGGLFAVVAASAQVGIGRSLGEHFRLSLQGQAAAILEDGSGAYTLGLAIARIGRGSQARFDFGAHAGFLAVDGGEGGWVAGPFLGWSWELWRAFSIGARFAVDLASVEGGDVGVWPSAALIVELPLS